MYLRKLILILTIILIIISTSYIQAAEKSHHRSSFEVLKKTTAPIWDIKIINVYQHDPDSFTEGLVYHNGFLYESTGLNGKSAIKKIEIKSGKPIKEINLAEEYFGEGMAILNDKIYQLTWKNNMCFIYDLLSFREIRKVNYEGEGWGLTSDGRNLFMSDGSATIMCRDPLSFAVVRNIIVHDGKHPVNNINELEYIRGEIWANIFMEDVIVRISPQTGRVLGWIDLSLLYSELPVLARRDVLNGIAYDNKNDRIFVTGKFWPKLFEIKISKRTDS